jgi:hypothetical protein
MWLSFCRWSDVNWVFAKSATKRHKTAQKVSENRYLKTFCEFCAFLWLYVGAHLIPLGNHFVSTTKDGTRT